MKIFVIFGINMGGALVSTDEKLAFMTKLSKKLFSNLKIAIKESNGNVLITDLETSKETIRFGKIIHIPLKENYDLIFNSVVESIKEDQELFAEESLDSEIQKIDLDSLSKMEQDKIATNWVHQLITVIEQKNISVVITNAIFANKAAKIISSKYPANEIYLCLDQPIKKDGEFNLSTWNSWRIFCKAMEFNDEFPLTFAGVKKISAPTFNNETRPENLCRVWTFNEKAESS